MTVLPELDAITDRVLSYRPPRARQNPEPVAWAVSVERIFESNGLVLDASHFDPDLDSCMKNLHSSGLELKTLGELATVQLPSRFERVWATDAQHGSPYLNATDLLSLFAIGLPAKSRFLSPESDVDLDRLLIRQNWLLMTCSGTIGRIFHVPKRLDGWAATHDLIRIAPQPGMVGYLFAWCMTDAARIQVLAHTHGGQIDHVTDEQVSTMLVPMLPGEAARKLDRSVLRALDAREKGLKRLENLWPQ